MDIRFCLNLLLLALIFHLSHGATEDPEKQEMNKENSIDCEAVICPHILDPVCGIFGTKLVPFANQCEFDIYNCKLQQKEGKRVRLGNCPDWHVFYK